MEENIQWLLPIYLFIASFITINIVQLSIFICLHVCMHDNFKSYERFR